ncbi:hypothetical protein Pmani_035214 [Petrolisthes manimaculis]|uniref:Uncharacterized protein n=1 Tax=Petrolisthes manimaculis TaxID=1843537 RepID=A0AAE1NMA0_9EUCA|nr:hypothetical protein Pmani_035214 [Petrolisthes manimaculis]
MTPIFLLHHTTAAPAPQHPATPFQHLFYHTCPITHNCLYFTTTAPAPLQLSSALHTASPITTPAPSTPHHTCPFHTTPHLYHHTSLPLHIRSGLIVACQNICIVNVGVAMTTTPPPPHTHICARTRTQ